MPSLEVFLNGQLLAILREDEPDSGATDSEDLNEVPMPDGYVERLAAVSRMKAEIESGIGVTFESDGRWRIRDGISGPTLADRVLGVSDVVLIRVTE